MNDLHAFQSEIHLDYEIDPVERNDRTSPIPVYGKSIIETFECARHQNQTWRRSVVWYKATQSKGALGYLGGIILNTHSSEDIICTVPMDNIDLYDIFS